MATNENKKKDAETTMTLEQMQAEMKRMLDEAKAEAVATIEAAKTEAAQIVAEAKTVGEKKGAISDEEREKQDKYWNEYVEVKLFKDNGRYSDDVFVSVNGETCLIKRGERVKIKRKFAAVLESSDLQDYETAKLIERESSGDKYAGTV